MPLDGLTLRFVVGETQCLVGGRIDKVSQPESDMAVLLIRHHNRNDRLLLSASPAMARFHLTDEVFANPDQAPMFCMLMRKHLIGGHIESIEQPCGDRVVRITVASRDELGESGRFELWLEVMGRHSNLSLVRDGKIIDCLRHVGADMSRVRHLQPGLPFTPPPRQDKLTLEELTPAALEARLADQRGSLSHALLQCVTGLSPVSAREWALRATGLSDAQAEDADIPAVAQKLSDFAGRMTSLGPACCLTDEAGRRVDYFPFPYLSYPADRQVPAPSLCAAMTAFYALRERSDRMQQKSTALKRSLKTALDRDEKKLLVLEDALRDAADADRYRLYGELLSAQLHLVAKGQREAVLPNFYDEENRPVRIPLDETLSPAQNAQRYFKRYKKALASRKTAAEQKERCLEEIRLLEEALFSLDQCETAADLQEVRQTLTEQGFMKPDRNVRRKKPPVSAPLQFRSRAGYLISAGKNSLQNERLTHDADGDDLWLHAKDMPGSHVILHLRHEAPDADVLMEAARVAAWYSKARGVSVPVDYTFRRYVKKPGGTPAGFVTFTHNRTLLISCAEADLPPLVEPKT